MADIISQNAYEAILRIPEDQRSQKMVDAVNDFLNAKYNIPPKKDYQKAIAVLNAVSKRPNTHTFTQEQIELAKQIEQQDREGRALMKANEQNNGYIRDVKRVPDDIGKEYGFKFNWKSAYENETGKKLRPNEADAKKLEQYISNKVSDYEKGEDLRQTANDMKMYSNKELNSWSNFIGGDSNNSKEFKNFLKDMQKIQQDKRLNEIWNEESNVVTDFMLPVSKEYAKKNYENINGIGDMAKPLLFDAASNGAMMLGGGANRYVTGLERVIRNPYLGAVASPIIHGAGDYLNDNKDAKGAALETAIGVGTNLMMPFYGQKAYNKLDRILPEGTLQNKQIIQNKVDDAVNRYKDYKEAVAGGAIVPRLKKAVIGDNDPETSYFVQQDPINTKDKIFSKIPYLKKYSKNKNKEIRYVVDVDGTKKDLDKYERMFKNYLDPNRPDIEVKHISDIPSSLSEADIPQENAYLFANDYPYAENRNIFSKIFNSNDEDLIRKRNSIINTHEVHKAIEELKKNPEYRKLEQDINQKYSNQIREARKNGNETLSSKLRKDQFVEFNNLWDRFGMRAKDVRQKLKNESSMKAMASQSKHGDVSNLNIRDLDLNDLILAGYKVPNESKLNKVVRGINKNKVLKSYIENMQGRDIYASPLLNSLNFFTGNRIDWLNNKEKKPSLIELYGLGQDN